MNKRIHKYQLNVGGNDLQVPRGAKPLSVQVQHGEAVLWMLVDVDAPIETFFVLTVGTGWAFPEPPNGQLIFIDTFQLDEGNLVFHAFYLEEPAG